MYGIAASGESVGYSISPQDGQRINFTFDKGEYASIRIPHTSGLGVLGINPMGTAIVGGYASSAVNYGFVYQNGALQTLQFPGSNTTAAVSINIHGEVVGYFEDSNSVTHGFTWTPPPDAGKK
jgi:probable HAF family extracellular repeat protein